MWRNIVELDRPCMVIWRMCIAYWLTKAIDTHSEYAILIVFPLQKWLDERASILRLTSETPHHSLSLIGRKMKRRVGNEPRIRV
jgi:galactose-1-phosphate uridylyltransferase